MADRKCPFPPLGLYAKIIKTLPLHLSLFSRTSRRLRFHVPTCVFLTSFLIPSSKSIQFRFFHISSWYKFFFFFLVFLHKERREDKNCRKFCCRRFKVREKAEIAFIFFFKLRSKISYLQKKKNFRFHLFVFLTLTDRVESIRKKSEWSLESVSHPLSPLFRLTYQEKRRNLKKKLS